MKKYEYEIIQIHTSSIIGRSVNYPDISSKMNKMGKQGWELVNFGNSKLVCGKGDFIVAVFKREVPEGKKECQKCCACPKPEKREVARADEVQQTMRGSPQKATVATMDVAQFEHNGLQRKSDNCKIAKWMD